MEKELRKRQNLLVEAGIGVILFAVWSVVRVNLYLGFMSFSNEEVYRVADEIGINRELFIVYIISMIAVVLLSQLGTRLYIGLSAAAEGKGKAKGWGYLVLTAIILAMDLHGAWKIYVEEGILAGEETLENLIMGICLETASVYVMLELLISGICVKRLRKKMKV